MFEREPMVPMALYQALLDKYHALKLAGAVEVRAREPKPVIPPAPAEDELALAATAREWTDNLTTAMTERGVNPRDAKAWAETQVRAMSHGLITP